MMMGGEGDYTNNVQVSTTSNVSLLALFHFQVFTCACLETQILLHSSDYQRLMHVAEGKSFTGRSSIENAVCVKDRKLLPY